MTARNPGLRNSQKGLCESRAEANFNLACPLAEEFECVGSLLQPQCQVGVYLPTDRDGIHLAIQVESRAVTIGLSGDQVGP
jgi:hypothetical protein